MAEEDYCMCLAKWHKLNCTAVMYFDLWMTRLFGMWSCQMFVGSVAVGVLWHACAKFALQCCHSRQSHELTKIHGMHTVAM